MKRALFVGSLLGLLRVATSAAVLTILPTDPPATSYARMESARAGDEVIIAPGTYTFRVHLTAHGTAAAPITIHAQDPANKPVWDFTGVLVENAPGSYGAGDRGRAAWQVDGGSNYRISGIVFKECHTSSQNAGGIRYFNGTTGLYLKDCIFRNNDNGLTGGSQDSDATVEFCEFDGNGNLAAASPTHNMYIYGGTFALRYCYVHDSVQAENFHIRAHSSTLEYNWLARAKNYEGDLMTDGDLSGPGPFTQTMTLRGNLFLQSPNPDNHSQVVVLFNDTRLTNATFSVQVIGNTYVGNGIPASGGGAAFVHLANSDGTQMSAQVMNNIIYGTTVPTAVDNGTNGTVGGGNNWLPTGVNPGPLTNSIVSASPGFQNAAAKDFTLQTNSAAVGSANQSFPGLPIREYFQNETNCCQYRLRARARDVGAFESTTTGAAIGPYATPPAPSLKATRSGAAVIISWPVTAQDYTLDQTMALGSSVNWTQFPSPYATNPSQVQVTVPASGTSEFFRLRHP